MDRKVWSFIAVLCFCIAQGWVRYTSRELVAVGTHNVYREFDPRGREVEGYRKRTERTYFKLNSNFARAATWPGLSAMDFSLTWLRILSSTYDEVTVEGDFSWLFHKLKFISEFLPKEDTSFQTAMLPFFVVLGKDPAGALYLFNEKIAQGRDLVDWKVCYWAGFHALENLHEEKMAGDLFLRAALVAGAPRYLAALGFRLQQGRLGLDQKTLRHEALKKLSPELLEKLRALRPEWFE